MTAKVRQTVAHFVDRSPPTAEIIRALESRFSPAASPTPEVRDVAADVPVTQGAMSDILSDYVGRVIRDFPENPHAGTLDADAAYDLFIEVLEDLAEEEKE
ncbi:hypothetical protein [Streptomyces sp. NPDC047028]|uniref:hypothetical protein n=1 Tax=Streptomyces sp. NPDC047028 TaxID=3155793 RepID=UPI0033FDCFF1